MLSWLLPIIGLSVITLTVIVLWVGKHYQQADWGSRWLNYLDGLNRFLCQKYHGLKHPLLPIPMTGPVVIAANHISGLDPLLMIAMINRPLRFLIAKEQYERFGLQWFFRRLGCIPVDRHRRPQAAMRGALRALQAGEVVALFPQGGIQHPTQAKKVSKLKGGVVKLAIMSAAPIYTLRFSCVRAQGQVFLPILLPNKVVVVSYPPLYCQDNAEESCLDHIQRHIE